MDQVGPIKRLGRAFFNRDPRVVAVDLIGHGVVRRVDGDWVGGVIVETEAYLSADDPASHSHSGPTRRCQSMFGQPGTLYVYSIHAKYCMNLVTEKQGVGSAVLIRALEPQWGIEIMKRHREQDDLYKLLRGPGMICQALAITTRDDGIDLVTSDEISIIRLPVRENVVGHSARIGLRAGDEMPFRFYKQGSRFVSGTVKQRS